VQRKRKFTKFRVQGAAYTEYSSQDSVMETNPPFLAQLLSYELPPLKRNLLRYPARRVHQSISSLDTTHLPRRVVLTAMPLDITCAQRDSKSRAVFANFRSRDSTTTPKTTTAPSQSYPLSSQCPKRTGIFKCDFCLRNSKWRCLVQCPMSNVQCPMSKKNWDIQM